VREPGGAHLISGLGTWDLHGAELGGLAQKDRGGLAQAERAWARPNIWTTQSLYFTHVLPGRAMIGCESTSRNPWPSVISSELLELHKIALLCYRERYECVAGGRTLFS
jgi:hypothetical protein